MSLSHRSVCAPQYLSEATCAKVNLENIPNCDLDRVPESLQKHRSLFVYLQPAMYPASAIARNIKKPAFDEANAFRCRAYPLLLTVHCTPRSRIDSYHLGCSPEDSGMCR